MRKNYTILIGGIQGEGVISTGINLMKALSKKGYYTLGERKFSSRIKGGNTHIIITISNEPVNCIESSFDLILAMDQESVYENVHRLHSKGMILHDQAIEIEVDKKETQQQISLPISQIAKDQGKLFMKNTSAIGFLGKVLGITYQELERAVVEAYGAKGEDILSENLTVLHDSFENDACRKAAFFETNIPMSGSENSKMIMIGNEGIALGAVMAGCRFMAGYPITPASDVMENLSIFFQKTGGKIVQTEDEISAMAMSIGASYSGVRSMTATSGPGMTLMGEGMGLAGMTETPIVIVDAQRAGPSTGMPTKTEQSDVAFLYYAGHGEFSSVILTPSSIEECYELTIHAFEIADYYQCPVIILTDLHLSLSPKTIDAIPYNSQIINKGKLAEKEKLKDFADGGFPRYQLTEDGISPRAFPGTFGGQHQVTGLEHNELGRPSDKPDNRIKMMKKRMHKTDALMENEEIIIEGEGGDVLFLAFGSVYGVIKEARLRIDFSVDVARIRQIKPLPLKQLERIMNNYKKIIIVEENFNGQLAQIIRQELRQQEKIISITRYDGENFTLEEMMESMKRWC
ncbi:2-oxoacid:acceptor oxidoreductase subunit alpha [Tindallia californiensis]|uniref:2-oxoglutarate ferredoxin oxidoreductase subunit alpha n=1 Tax=Tindallia californiensis TaxID=159292 RepID=A0A1H3JMV6_9FIRM|nr:2-oxoacid:acceptor oxidoreductase subunit alpha [Tindallia californiensis]SDY40949.1 2-oxoglutarate ferredoxin oxidoreductase subunit alpha [Tindallia californiensis]